MMQRFFIHPADISGRIVRLTGENANHIARVLRMRPGESVVLCDGCKTDYIASLQNIGKTEVTAAIEQTMPSAGEPDFQVTLFQAMPKGTKMDSIIQKCTELGVSKIIPCNLSRCVVKLEGDADAKKKTMRWRSIAEAAAKQSQRGIIPVVEQPVSFDRALSMMKAHDFCFAAYELETQQDMRALLQRTAGRQVRSVAFLVGPEGGISDAEAELLCSNGIPTVHLGSRILRTETAPLLILSILMYEFDK